MLKRLILFIGLFVVLSFLIVPIFFSVNKDTIHIEFASWGSESEVRILKPILKEFENQNNDIKIDFMHIPQNYFQKIHLLFASNTAPDVIFINNLYLPIYANAGVLEDLSKKDIEYDKFYPMAISAMEWKGKIYAVPRDVSNLVIFYNKDLFKKYNVPFPKENWNYNDYIETAQKLTKNGNFGASFDENPLYFLTYFAMYDKWTKNETNNYFKADIFTDPQIQQALKNYADLRYKYHIAPLKKELGSMTNGQLFLQGRIGMYLSGRWMVPKIRNDAKFDWDVIEFPTLTKDRKSSVLTDSSGWAVNKYSKHKKEALKLIKYLSSQNTSTKFTKSGLIVPARMDTANSYAFIDNKKPLNYKAFLNSAKYSKPTPVTVNYNEILDDLKTKTEKYFNQ